jgi:hypothetical protein
MMELLSPQPIFLPVFVLVLWSLVMLMWLAVTRLPYIAKNKFSPDAGERTSELAAQMPKEIQWKADNYNHLMEQPTIFYAITISMAVAGLGDGLNLYLAWFYVATRIVHSLVHATVNIVLLRLAIFMLGSVTLVAMTVNGLLAILG